MIQAKKSLLSTLLLVMLGFGAFVFPVPQADAFLAKMLFNGKEIDPDSNTAEFLGIFGVGQHPRCLRDFEQERYPERYQKLEGDESAGLVDDIAGVGVDVIKGLEGVREGLLEGVADTVGVPLKDKTLGIKEFAEYDTIFDGPGLKCGSEIARKRVNRSISTQRDLKTLIIQWTNFFLSVIALVAVVAIVWAGYLYITSFADEANAEKAKKIIFWAAIGILVVFVSFPLVNSLMRAAFHPIA